MMVLAVFALVLVAILVRGWALMVLWGWFIVPTFAGAPNLTIPSALGIAALFGLFTSHLAQKTATNKEPDPYKAFGDAMGTSVGGALVSVGIGWIITLFM